MNTTICGCKVAFEFADDGERTVPNEAQENALMTLRGRGWSAAEMDYGPCAAVLVVEFEGMPSVRLVESVRRAVNARIRNA